MSEKRENWLMRQIRIANEKIAEWPREERERLLREFNTPKQ